MAQSLLPGNSGLFEKALETSFAPRWTVLGEGTDAIAYDKVSPPSAFLPFVIWEFGLGELTPYVPNLYDLLQEGIQWQRVRGTFLAVQRGLAWLGYTAAVEQAWHGRTWWNSYQLRFDRLPDHDDPDLERIEGITTLSVPKRSQLRRGVFQYDIPAAVCDWKRLDATHLDRESGVTATPANTLWSFGRTTEVSHLLTQAEGQALGIWIDPPATQALKWADMQFPWVTATFPWASNATVQRQNLMATFFRGRIIYAVLKDEAGAIIGYRRCRAVHPVDATFDGPYRFSDLSYAPVAAPRLVYIEAMTDFGDAENVVAKSISLLVEPVLSAGIAPGRLWLNPGELSGGVPIIATDISVPLRATVREQFKFLVRF
ncbi:MULTISPECIES: phage tail protein [unclassified Rhizobium]|uniref:phage tail protein n=1 Tax=unclassified Rhizobium TaxID=2613769 RepID=UPI00288B3860|nr:MULTISPECIES: phage tail protein [unclassified Rhizobium]